LTVVKGQDRQAKTYEATDSVKLNFTSFADAIEGKAPFMISHQQMIHNAAVMEAITKSVETGNQVAIG